jgi:CRP-like cAMP-binding protein
MRNRKNELELAGIVALYCAAYADLAQRIPQYMIASYVGVQPESLSRIRRRLAQHIS